LRRGIGSERRHETRSEARARLPLDQADRDRAAGPGRQTRRPGVRGRGPSEKGHMNSDAARVLVGEHSQKCALAKRLERPPHPVADFYRLDSKPGPNAVEILVASPIALRRKQ